MGSYGSVAAALGLSLHIVDPQRPAHAADDAIDPAATLPARLLLAEYPQLRRLAWQRDDTAEIEPREALAIYERNWRHVDPQALEPRERALLTALGTRWGGGRLLV